MIFALRADMTFNVGRGPDLVVGEEQSISLAVNLPSVILKSLGQYTFTIEVDGSRETELSYRLMTPAGMTIGIGPSAQPGRS